MKQITDDDIELIKFYISQRKMLKVFEILNSLEEIQEIKLKNEELPAN